MLKQIQKVNNGSGNRTFLSQVISAWKTHVTSKLKKARKSCIFLLTKISKSCFKIFKNRGGLEKYGSGYKIQTLKISFKCLNISKKSTTAQEIALFCHKSSQLQKRLSQASSKKLENLVFFCWTKIRKVAQEISKTEGALKSMVWVINSKLWRYFLSA